MIEGLDSASVESAWIGRVVARVVASFAPHKPATVGRDEALVDELGYDSLLLMEMRFGLEELFDLQLDMVEEPAPMNAVWEVQDFVVAKVAAGEATAPSADAVEAFLRPD